LQIGAAALRNLAIGWGTKEFRRDLHLIYDD
jgi:hypothetical protein